MLPCRSIRCCAEHGLPEPGFSYRDGFVTTIRRRPVQVSASLRHVGERFHSDANTVRLSAYTTLDAALAVDVARGVQLTLRGRNLTNRVYAAWADPFYPDQILLGAPRSVELALRWTL